MKAKLADVEQRARELSSFKIPPRGERESLTLGDSAKVVFLLERKPGGPSGERMWLTVIEVLGKGSYRGEIDSEPWDAPYVFGDLIDFEACHVCAIEKGPHP
jgi:hypothetical protein